MNINEKQLLKLIKFLSWVFLGLLIIFIGLSKSYALTTTTAYANSDLTSSNKYYATDMNGSMLQRDIGTNYQSRTALIRFYTGFSTGINKNYKVRINFYGDDLERSFNSDDVHIKSYNGTNWVDATLISIAKQNTSGYSTWLEMTFSVIQASTRLWFELYKNDNSGGFITGSQYYGITSIQYEVIDTNTDIMNNANANANNIINNQNNNTQNIIDNDTSNTQAIIDNQNSSTQAIIDSQYTCKNQTLDLYDYLNETGYLNSSGAINSNSDYKITDYIKIQQNQEYTFTMSYVVSSPKYCTYDKDKTLITCYTYGTNTTTFNSSNAYYIRASVRTGSNRTHSFIGDICLKDSDEQTKTSKGILGKLKELITNLFDSSGPDTSQLNNAAGWLPAGPVDSLINLPLTFFNQLNTSLAGQCNAVNVSLPFVNKTLSLPCWSDYMNEHLNGFQTLWTFIGGIACVVILYRYLLALYAWVDDVLMLRYNLHEDFGGNSSNFGGV